MLGDVIGNIKLMSDRYLLSATNTFIGIDTAGAGNLAHTGGNEGWRNTAIGNSALYSLTDGELNTCIGYNAGYSITTGSRNLAMGQTALDALTTGSDNSGQGNASMSNLISGGSNVGFGGQTLLTATTCSFNTAIGHQALYTTNANYSSALGYRAGYASTAANCVYLGTSAGYNNTTARRLFIADTDTADPLIYGAFDDGTVMINDYLYQAGTYAEIWLADGSTDQAIATGASYVKLTHFTDNGASSNCTAAAASDKITITKAGLYLVSGSCSFSCDTNLVSFRIAAFLDGTEQDHIHFIRKMGAGGDIGSASMTGIIDVTSVPLDLDMRARHDNGGSVDIQMNYSNFNVLYLGET